MSEATKSVSVPTFSGKEEDYELFWPRFEAYADMKGFAEAIDWENPDPDLPSKHNVFDTDADVNRRQEAAIKRNKTDVPNPKPRITIGTSLLLSKSDRLIS